MVRPLVLSYEIIKAYPCGSYLTGILMELSFQLPVIRKESAVEPLVTQTWGMAAGVTLNSMGVLFSYYYSMRDPDAGIIPLAWPLIQPIVLLSFSLAHGM